MSSILSRLLVRVAVVAASLAWAGFVFTHTIGDPHRGERIAAAVLADDAARGQVVAPITNSVMTSTGLPAEQRPMVALEVDRLLRDPSGEAAFIAPFAGSWSRHARRGRCASFAVRSHPGARRARRHDPRLRSVAGAGCSGHGAGRALAADRAGLDGDRSIRRDHRERRPRRNRSGVVRGRVRDRGSAACAPTVRAVGGVRRCGMGRPADAGRVGRAFMGQRRGCRDRRRARSSGRRSPAHRRGAHDRRGGRVHGVVRAGVRPRRPVGAGPVRQRPRRPSHHRDHGARHEPPHRSVPPCRHVRRDRPPRRSTSP